MRINKILGVCRTTVHRCRIGRGNLSGNCSNGNVNSKIEIIAVPVFGRIPIDHSRPNRRRTVIIGIVPFKQWFPLLVRPLLTVTRCIFGNKHTVYVHVADQITFAHSTLIKSNIDLVNLIAVPRSNVVPVIRRNIWFVILNVCDLPSRVVCDH
jgi:hypothetical protein